MSEVKQESPLVANRRLDRSNALPGDAGIRLGERLLPGLINLRGQSEDAAFGKAVAKAAGVEPPLNANTVAVHGEFTLCWLGPDEWLIVTPPEGAGKLIDKLHKGLADRHAAVTDVSGGFAAITLSGPDARRVLAKGCTLDLHPREFTTGHCAQSLLAKAGVVLIARGENDFEIVVRRSFADYLWRWLVDAAEEYGLAVQ